MMGLKNLVLSAVMLAFVVGGCALQEKILPLHDEVLIYELPFDLTYLRTFEALETLEDWEVIETEKEKGMIRVRNVAFGKFGDADQRVVTFLLDRMDREHTTIQLASESQRVLGGGLLLERVGEFLSKELS